MKKPKSKKKVRPARVWAVVCCKTNRIIWLGKLKGRKAEALRVSDCIYFSSWRGVRIVRVKIKEI